MPASPEYTRIIAVIPNETNPDLRLVDSDGDYPSVEHPGGQTFETTFRQMSARKKLGLGTLSVARRLAHLEEPDDIAYEAKPVAGDPDPESGYFWKARE